MWRRQQRASRKVQRTLPRSCLFKDLKATKLNSAVVYIPNRILQTILRTSHQILLLAGYVRAKLALSTYGSSSLRKQNTITWVFSSFFRSTLLFILIYFPLKNLPSIVRCSILSSVIL
jgi:hypothetical protein